MSDNFTPLTIDEYARQAALTDQRKGKQALSFSMLGVFGETGSLLSEVKKKQRDKASYLGYADAVAEELGDVLWYVASIARRSQISLSTIAANAANGKAKLAPAELTFHALQPAQIPIGKEPTTKFEHRLLAMAGQIGLLVNEYQSGVLKDKARLLDRLTQVMQQLIEAANDAGVTLEIAAIKNLHKIFDRWPRERNYPPAFDADMDIEEQLPRRLTIDVFERTVQIKNVYVYQKSSGVFVGDRLTDNALEPDDYRFHDVFHYAHVAVLGWSPVVRALLRLKRKSDPKLDEAEDGARAILIEEGVTSWIFGHAQKLDFFEGVKTGGLPLDMLKHVRDFVGGYEADRCPLWLWEEAILQGYQAFRFLQKHRRGRIQIDFSNRRLRAKELPL